MPKDPEVEAWFGNTARSLRFADRADVRRQRAALQAAVKAWCEMKVR